MNKYSDLINRSKLYTTQETSTIPSPVQKESLIRLPCLKLTSSKSTATSPTSLSPPLNIRSQTETPLGISQLSHLSNKGFPNLSISSPRLSLKLPSLEQSSSQKVDFSSILEQIETIAGPKKKSFYFVMGRLRLTP